jgi:hypothetical protein
MSVADGGIYVWSLEPLLRCVGTLTALSNGWVEFAPKGRYKVGGDVRGGFWHEVSECRFGVGELDSFVAGLRAAGDEPLFAH